MTTLDLGMARLRSAASRVSDGWSRFNVWYKAFVPKGLYARALLIIIAPMVILQSVVAFVFMERHWNLATRHLSAAVVGDIAALAEMSKVYPQEPDYARLRKIAQDRMGLNVDFLPLSDMPPPGPKPFFSLLDQALSVELRKQIGRPFWIDTVGRSSLVEIRIQLELALVGERPEVEAMKKDVDEMGRMLEAYLAFARGDTGEQAAPTDMADFLDELKTDAERNGHRTNVTFHGYPIVTVKPAAFKRCLGNLVSNAARFAKTIDIVGHRDHRYLTVTIDDDGPGIPIGMREEVFKPFLRLDDARNQDEGGTGLGLAIARDIARSHGGDITLDTSPLGGLRARVRVPV